MPTTRTHYLPANKLRRGTAWGKIAVMEPLKSRELAGIGLEKGDQIHAILRLLHTGKHHLGSWDVSLRVEKIVE